MLHHVSFNARDPENVARVLAEMLGATAIRSPSPPFPSGSQFVCYGDAGGSLLEIIPRGHVFDPAAPFGLGYDPDMRERAGAHVLVSTPHSSEFVRALAARAGWRSEIVDARLFKVLKVWIENAVLIELLTPEMSADYVATFGEAGLTALDGKLRELEAAAGEHAAADAGESRIHDRPLAERFRRPRRAQRPL